MSTFLNTTTNVTAPYESCSYLPVLSPPDNDTLVGCSIPNCRANQEAMEKCCTGTGRSLTTFNETQPVSQLNITINAEYLTCTVDQPLSGYNFSTKYDPKDPYFQLPDCLVQNGGTRLLCNRPDSEYDSCPGPNGIQTADGTGMGYSTCVVNNQNENITSLLNTCCSSANGTIRSEVAGCEISCSGDETLQSCLETNYRGSLLGGSGGAGYLCSNNTNTGGAATLGGSGRTTLAGVLFAAVAAVAFLQ